MRRVTATMFVSLDGVIQAPGGPDEDRTDGFEHGGWILPYRDEITFGTVMGHLLDSPYELLLGRRTYDIFAAYWPTITDANPIAARFNAALKHVLTHRPEPLTWPDSRALADIGAVAALKATDGPDLLVQGSSTLLPQLLSAGLLDRLVTYTYPVVLGGGRRLFAGSAPHISMTLISSVASPTGVVISTYAPRYERA